MKTRVIYTHIWQDDNFATLPSEAQKLALYLMTNRTAGLIPVYTISDREVMFDCGFTLKELQVFRKLLEKIDIFFEEQYYIILNSFSYSSYSGGKTVKARNQEILQLSPAIKKILTEKEKYKMLLGNDTSIIDTINNKSKIINNKSKIKSVKITTANIRILGTKKVIKQFQKEFPKEDLKYHFSQLRDWKKANNVKKDDWISYARTWIRRESRKTK